MAWRALAAWIGGLAAICVVLVIFTRLNLGGARLHPRALLASGSSDVIVQIRVAATTIAPLYALITLAVALLIAVIGAPLAQAAYIAAGTVSLTGLPLTAPIAEHLSLGIVQVILVAGCIAASINWDTLLSSLVRRNYTILNDPEVLTFGVVICVTLLLVILVHMAAGDLGDLWSAIFLAVSALTTLGWSTGAGSDSSLAMVMLLIALASIGGCLITSGGGVKQLRLRLLVKLGRRELDRLGHPSGAYPLRFADRAVESQDIGAMWLLLSLTTLTLLSTTLLLSAQGIAFETAFMLGITHLTLAAPLVAEMDPSFFGFSGLYDGELMVLSLVMLIGRVETVVLLLLLGRRMLR